MKKNYTFRTSCNIKKTNPAIKMILLIVFFFAYSGFNNAFAQGTITLGSPFGSDAQTVCSNDPITNISYNVGGSATSATVAGLPAGISGSYNSGIFLITGVSTISGAFNYVVTTVGGTSVTAIGTITINPLPVLMSSLTTTVCSGTSLSYMPSTNPSVASTAWTRAAVSGISNPASNGTGYLTETLINTTQLSVNVSYVFTISANGCSNIQNVVAAVNPLPVLSSPLTPAPACSGTSHTYIPASSTPGTTFAWTRAVTTGISNAAANGADNALETLINTSTVPLSVTYLYTLTANGCSNTQSVVLPVNIDVTASIALTSGGGTNAQTNCAGSALTDITYEVYGGTGAEISGLPSDVTGSFSSGIFIISGTPVATGTFNYTLTTTGTCTAATASGTITVKPLPSVNAGAGRTICASQSTILSASGNASSYFWNNSVVDGTSFIPPNSKNYIVHGILNGCTNSDSVIVTVNPLPPVNAGADFAVCAGQSATLTAGGDASSYNWNNGVINSTAFIPSNTNTYVLTGTSNSCSNYDTITITVNQLPAITTQPAAPASFCQGIPASASIAVTAAGAGLTYQWRKGGVPLNNTAPYSNVTAAALIITNPGTAENGAGIDVLISGTCPSSVTSTPVTITVNTAPVITCTDNKTANTTAGLCTAVVSYSAPTVIGSPTPTVTYSFSGATTGNGTGSGSGSAFNKGVTIVTLTASNTCGTQNCQFSVTVNDNINPTITPPIDVSTTTNAGCTATGFLLGTPVTADNCGVAGVSNDAPAAFPLGNTIVTWTVTDGSSNTATASQTVTVTDNINPTITAPADVSVTINSGCTATGVSLGTPVTGDNCSVANVSSNAPAAFPLGNTFVIWTVTDGSSNTATAIQIVTVSDNINPTITAPADVNITTNSGCTATSVSLGIPVTTDNCSVANFSNNAPASFPLGNTIVTWTVTDGSSNTATANQTVTVTDNINPTITAPADVNITTNSGCTATGVTLGTPVTADNCTVVAVTNNAPAAFPLGSTTVLWTVTDGSANISTTSQTVTVTDNVNPTITAPADITVCDGASIALGTPVTTDNCSVAAVINNAPGSYPVGATTVTWTVTDGSGNTASAAQIVTVNPLPALNSNISPPPICSGTAFNYNPASSVPGSTFTWTRAAVLGISNAAGVGIGNPSETLNNTTAATVNLTYVYTINANGCTNSVAYNVITSVSPSPYANTGSITPFCFGDTAYFTNNSTGAISYSWNFGDGSTSFLLNPLHFYASAGSYIASLTVQNNSGCAASDSVLVQVTQSKDIYVHASYLHNGTYVDVTNGNVVIYKQSQSQTHFDALVTAPLDSSGNYHFTEINHGNYLVKVVADSAAYPTLVPTYNGSVFLWNDSSVIVINHDCASNDSADIKMTVTEGTGGGIGLLIGHIIQGPGFGRNDGDPIPGVDVKLGKNPGGSLMATSTTNSSGTYTFSNVAFGNYTIYADIPGYGRDSSYTFTVDSTHNQFVHMDYKADSTSIYINPYSPLGINNSAIAAENKFIIYPNPVIGNTTIEYSISKLTDAKIILDVYNALGVKIRSLVNADQQPGNYKYNISTRNNNLNSGVYFITLTIDGRSNTKRIVVIE